MSFWRTFGFQAISAIDSILDRDSFTLEELLDEEDILQETKTQNKKLLEYLVKPETLAQLFKYLTEEPQEDADNKRKFKYPFLAQNILSSDIWTIYEAIIDQGEHIDTLLKFFDKETLPDSKLDAHVSKVAGVLVTRKPKEILPYLKKNDVITKLLRHFETPSVMDLLLKIIGADENVDSQYTAWLCESNLIPQLVANLSPKNDSDVHENVAQTLIDIILLSQSPNSPLIAQLETEETVNQLLTFVLTPNARSSLLFGLTVVIELLNRHAQEFHSTASIDELPSFLKHVLAKLGQFTEVAKSPLPPKVQLTCGAVSPLGFPRLKIIEFFLGLSQTNYQVIEEALQKAGVYNIVLDLFFEIEWNNFLHAIVEQIVVAVIRGENKDLTLHLLKDCRLVERILKATKANDAAVAAGTGVRKGNMGFITSISTYIVNELQELDGEIGSLLRDNQEWITYVNVSLAETKRIENQPLGGSKPMLLSYDMAPDGLSNDVLKYLMKAHSFHDDDEDDAEYVAEDDHDVSHIELNDEDEVIVHQDVPFDSIPPFIKGKGIDTDYTYAEEVYEEEDEDEDEEVEERDADGNIEVSDSTNNNNDADSNATSTGAGEPSSPRPMEDTEFTDSSPPATDASPNNNTDQQGDTEVTDAEPVASTSGANHENDKSEDIVVSESSSVESEPTDVLSTGEKHEQETTTA